MTDIVKGESSKALADWLRSIAPLEINAMRLNLYRCAIRLEDDDARINDLRAALKKINSVSACICLRGDIDDGTCLAHLCREALAKDEGVK